MVAVALVLAGCGGGREDATAPPPPVSATDARPAPDIEGTTLDGERMSLVDFRGRPVFVNVWSSW
jgi:hypothetical protein